MIKVMVDRDAAQDIELLSPRGRSYAATYRLATPIAKPIEDLQQFIGRNVAPTIIHFVCVNSFCQHATFCSQVVMRVTELPALGPWAGCVLLSSVDKYGFGGWSGGYRGLNRAHGIDFFLSALKSVSWEIGNHRKSRS
jgi:hypothetical protein